MRQDNDTLFLLLAPEMVAGDGGRFFLYRMDMSHLADKALAQHLAQRRLWQRKEPAAAVSEAAEQRSEPRSTVVTPLPPPQLMGLGNARTRVARTARGRHEGLLTVPGAQRGTSVPEGFPGARRIWPALAQPETKSWDSEVDEAAPAGNAGDGERDPHVKILRNPNRSDPRVTSCELRRAIRPQLGQAPSPGAAGCPEM
ncbi:uncharacterized protein LOC119870470 isoform X8 [Canis lupus familiaris]|uniref:uncharacterized protein LOC119870470 isoform X8 n=3 Tax=Canis lupus familiaris TaxID=9615 RepID=UPI0018F36A38|nr:uncharacterized protein LOC119870470 isoform X8 [Canis lupus familiaris]